MTFCESGENHQVGTDSTLPFQPGAGFPLWSDCSTCRLAAVALLDKVVDQLAGGVVHLHVEGFHLAGEVVEGHNRGDGHEQPESRGYQGLRDTAGDCADA